MDRQKGRDIAKIRKFFHLGTFSEIQVPEEKRKQIRQELKFSLAQKES